MIVTEAVPTDEQLREYAAELDPLYRDILAAYVFAEPNRQRGGGVFESTLRNFLQNMAFAVRANLPVVLRPWPVGRSPYKFSRAIDEYTDEEFSAAVDRLIEHGFIGPRDPNGPGPLIPTPVGERLIDLVAGKAESSKELPDLPKPMWR